MRFGRTREQARLDWVEAKKRDMHGYTRYAWLPIRVHDGSWVWLENYTKRATFSDHWTWRRYAWGDPQLEIDRKFDLRWTFNEF